MNSFRRVPYVLSSSEAPLGLSLASNGGVRDKRAGWNTHRDPALSPCRRPEIRLGRRYRRRACAPSICRKILATSSSLPRWRRSWRGGSALLCPALEARRPMRSHRSGSSGLPYKGLAPRRSSRDLRYSGRAHLFNGATGRERAKRACRMRRFPRVSV